MNKKLLFITIIFSLIVINSVFAVDDVSLRNGLVLYYVFSNNSDNMVGSTIIDWSGNRNGSIVSDVSCVYGGDFCTFGNVGVISFSNYASTFTTNLVNVNITNITGSGYFFTVGEGVTSFYSSINYPIASQVGTSDNGNAGNSISFLNSVGLYGLITRIGANGSITYVEHFNYSTNVSLDVSLGINPMSAGQIGRSTSSDSVMGKYYVSAIWNRVLNDSELSYLEAKLLANKSYNPYINTSMFSVSLNYPSNNTHFNSNPFTINYTLNNLAVCNCSLFINNVSVQTNYYVNGSDYFNYSNGVEGSYNLFVGCFDGVSFINSSRYVFVIDTTVPVWNISSINKSMVTHFIKPYQNWILFNDTVSDDNLFAYNVSVFYPNGSLWFFNDSFNTVLTSINVLSNKSIVNVPFGVYSINYYAEDDHTNASIREYGVRLPTSKDVVKKLEFTDSAKINIVPESDAISAGAVKEFDRYTFGFDYVSVKGSRVYHVTSDKPIYYRNKYSFPSFVTGKNWVDFASDTKGLSYGVRKISDFDYEITIGGFSGVSGVLFKSIGGLNIVNETYNFEVTTDYSFSSTDGVFGESSYINLSIDLVSNQSVNNVKLIYDGVVYDGILSSSKDWCTPHLPPCPIYKYYVIVSNTAIGNVSFFWNVSLTDYGNVFNFSTVNGSHVVGGLSLNLSYFDTSLVSMSGKNVSLFLIGASSGNYSTSTGVINISNLSSGDYVLVSSSEGYNQNTYIFSIDSTSMSNPLSIYLQPSNVTSLVLITVKDKFGKILSGVEVKIQRYIDNSWITEQIYLTDFQGRAEAYYILSTEFYNHILSYEGTTYFGAINSDANKKLIYAEDVSSGLNFNINILGSSVLPVYQKTLDVYANLTYVVTSNSSGYFRFYWDDPDNKQVEGCLEVVNMSNNAIVFFYCSNTATGTIISDVISIINDTKFFKAVGYLDGYVKKNLLVKIGLPKSDDILDWGVMGYLIAFLLLLIGFFGFIHSPTISLIVGTIIFILLGVFGVIFGNLSGKDYGIFFVLAVITFLIANIKSSSGVNR